jgi:hypothetical protein
MPPRRALPMRPRTTSWAEANAKSSWQQRAGAIGGGTEARLQWRKMRVITDSWVMAAMIRSEPRWHNGHVARARSKTRPKSLALYH